MALMQIFAIDDNDWLHYYAHYIKFGIGRTRFDASQELEWTLLGEVQLLQKYEGEYPKDI